VRHGYERDGTRRYRFGCQRRRRRLQRLELAPRGAVEDVPPSGAQLFADRIGRFEVALAPAFNACSEEPFSFGAVRCYPFLALTAAVSAGTIFSASPTTPRSAIFMIGASASLLMAMMIFDAFMPTVCCMAPEMPTAM
jgi:hypothetical protein